MDSRGDANLELHGNCTYEGRKQFMMDVKAVLIEAYNEHRLLRKIEELIQIFPDDCYLKHKIALFVADLNDYEDAAAIFESATLRYDTVCISYLYQASKGCYPAPDDDVTPESAMYIKAYDDCVPYVNFGIVADKEWEHLFRYFDGDIDMNHLLNALEDYSIEFPQVDSLLDKLNSLPTNPKRPPSHDELTMLYNQWRAALMA